MTAFLLIRHGMNDTVGIRIAGRASGVHLSEQGRIEAETLAGRLAGLKISAIYSSPLERALETAEPLARMHNLEVQTASSIGELDCGEWTGRSFEDLTGDPRWQRFNRFRAGTQVPRGELMLEAQVRMVTEVLRMRDRHLNQIVAVVSHADPIKSVITYFTGMPLEYYAKIEISPARVSLLEIDDEGSRLVCMNSTGAGINELLQYYGPAATGNSDQAGATPQGGSEIR